MTLLLPPLPSIGSASGLPPFPVVRFTVEKYHRLIASGVLDEDDPVELLRGWITFKMPRKPPHASTIARAQRLLIALLGDGWSVRAQSAVTLSDSEPEPDLAVAVGDDGRYDDHHPGPAELKLVVEVADSSLDRDRRIKAPIYAEAAIPTYWIINLVDRRIEVYTDPTGPADAPAYRSREDFAPDGVISLVGLAPVSPPVIVRDLFPAQP